MKKTIVLILVLLAVYGCTATNTQYKQNKVTKAPIKLKGPKKRIAVIKFEDKSANDWYQHDAGEGISDMLTTSLFKSGNFVVVEREMLEKIMEEQKLGEMGLTTQGSAAKLGKLLGVNAIITGSVSEFGFSEKSNSFGGRAVARATDGLISRVAVKSYTSRVAVDIKMIDTSTGEILLAETAAAEESASNLDFSSYRAPSFKIGADRFDSTIVGKASRKAINNLVDNISISMSEVPWKGYVLKVDGENVFINGGKNVGFEVGDLLEVRAPGEEVEDAEGRIFMIPGEKVAEVEVSAVLPEISKVKVLIGQGSINKDDVVSTK